MSSEVLAVLDSIGSEANGRDRSAQRHGHASHAGDAGGDGVLPRLGDDVYGEDPTINLLEEKAAAIFGREAAIFVPTGTMGNQVAIRLHTQHGQEVICESQGPYRRVGDGDGVGLLRLPVCGPCHAERGILTWQDIEPAIGAKIYYRAQTGLISLENTHNMAGGTVTPLAVLEEIWDGAAKGGSAGASGRRAHLQRSRRRWACR